MNDLQIGEVPAQAAGLPGGAINVKTFAGFNDLAAELARLERSEIMRNSGLLYRAITGRYTPLLVTYANNRESGIFAGVVRRGIRKSMLVLATGPEISDYTAFRKTLSDFCLKHSLHEVLIERYGCDGPPIPETPYDTSHFHTTIYVMDLRSDNFESAWSTNHKRNIKKAIKAGAEIAINTDTAAAEKHVALLDCSYQRRRDKGQKIQGAGTFDIVSAYLKSGKAALYQAKLNGEVMSSKLVIMLGDCAYYHSGGTHPDGMSVGLSQYTLAKTAALLKEKGESSLNLGVSNDEGLTRFKLGFRANAYSLERVSTAQPLPASAKIKNLINYAYPTLRE